MEEPGGIENSCIMSDVDVVVVQFRPFLKYNIIYKLEITIRQIWLK